MEFGHERRRAVNPDHQLGAVLVHPLWGQWPAVMGLRGGRSPEKFCFSYVHYCSNVQFVT